MSEGVYHVFKLNNTYFQSSTVLLSCFLQLGTKRLYSYTLSQRLYSISAIVKTMHNKPSISNDGVIEMTKVKSHEQCQTENYADPGL